MPMVLTKHTDFQQKIISCNCNTQSLRHSIHSCSSCPMRFLLKIGIFRVKGIRSKSRMAHPYSSHSTENFGSLITTVNDPQIHGPLSCHKFAMQFNFFVVLLEIFIISERKLVYVYFLSNHHHSQTIHFVIHRKNDDHFDSR